MKVLGIDSTAKVGSASVCENERILAEYSLDSGNTHSVTLLPMAQSVLKMLSLTPDKVELYALAAGPGSFTGVRIGAAMIKGLAFADNTPCIGVSSLAAMAEPYKGLSGIICPVINARRGQVYTALFRLGGDGAPPERLTDDDTLMTDDLCQVLEEHSETAVYLTGDAAEDVAAALKERKNTKSAPMILSQRAGAGAALLGERLYLEASEEERKAFTAEALAVLYLKKPQAEREREERLAADNNKR